MTAWTRAGSHGRNFPTELERRPFGSGGNDATPDDLAGFSQFFDSMFAAAGGGGFQTSGSASPAGDSERAREIYRTMAREQVQPAPVTGGVRRGILFRRPQVG